MSEFTCFKCRETFKKKHDKNWNDFKAAEEMLSLYPEAKNDPTETLCGICNEAFQKWFATLTEEDKRRMREDFFNTNSCN